MKDWAIVIITALSLFSGVGIALVQMESRITAIEESRQNVEIRAIKDLRDLEKRVLTVELTCCER